MKAIIIAFGHPENVLSLSKAVGKLIDLTLLFVFSGDCFKQGVLDIDLRKIPYGLSTAPEIIQDLIPAPVNNFIDRKFKIWILRTPSRKIVKDIKLKNYFLCRKTAKEIHRGNFDVIHFNGTSGFLLYFYWILRRYPKIWTLHDYISHSGEFSRKGALVNKFYTKLDFEFIQHYEYLKKEFCRYFQIDPTKVHQIYSGEFNIFKYFGQKKIDIPGNYILYFGRISRYKGLDYLIEAFELLAERIDNVTLVIAGAGRLWFDINKHEGQNKIIFLNRYIPTEELNHLVNNCMFVVTPYLDATHSAVIMTSFAYNKPVVSSNVGGVSEVIRDNKNGRLVPPANPVLLSEAMFELLKNPGKLKTFSKYIERMKTKGNYSWDYIGNKTVQVYNKVIRT
ncbi:MAG: glycosyltransferase family 4 protein [Candidatus Aminicenantes bacterium]|jgi:glycosyltransferase involved in cell wall biosynthesis